MILSKCLEEFVPQLAQVQEVEIDLAQPRYQRRRGAETLQPGREIIRRFTPPPVSFMDMIKERAQREPWHGLDEGGWSREALAGVVGHQSRSAKVQLQTRPAA